MLPYCPKPAAPRSYVPRRVSQNIFFYKTPWLRAQDLAVEGLLSPDELRVRLAALEEARGNALRELDSLDRRGEHIMRLESDRDALLETYARAVPKTFDELSPEERHRVYKLLGLVVLAFRDDVLEVRGVLNPKNLGTFGHAQT